jgi:molybdopterin/thiamine biosynthesis adenylyltransferase/rhodanese-related sulfurtransferase
VSTITTRDNFFKNQLNLLGKEEQSKIFKAKVLIVGVGGLGCPVLQFLALSGVGTIAIVDADCVSLSNLHRQTLFTAENIGQKKVQVAKQFIKQFSPHTEVIAIDERLVAANAKTLLNDFDIVVDCTDNFASKFLIHDTCFALNKYLVQASVYQFEGQLSTFDFTQTDSKHCLRCLWTEQPQERCTKNCAEVGVLPSVVNILGNLQALEVLKYILNRRTLKNGETLFADLIHLEFAIRNWELNSQCPLCSDSMRHILQSQEILLPTDLSTYTLVDLRTQEERENCFFLKRIKDHATLLPLDMSMVDTFDFDTNENYLFFCTRGIRSTKVANQLSEKYNSSHFYSLAGGVNSIL